MNRTEQFDSRKYFPRWMKELRRFQSLKSQLYLYGNVYDCYYFPVNYLDASEESELTWAKFDIIQLLTLYFRSEGYELITYYDMIDGLTVESSDPEINKANILKFLSDADIHCKSYFGSMKMNNIEKNISDVLSFFRCLVANRQNLSVGIVNYASRFSAEPDSLNEDERRCFLKILKSAQEACVFPKKGGMRNLLIMVCDRLNDIPGWILLENPLTKGIEVQKPNREERSRFFQCQENRFFQSNEDDDVEDSKTVFADLTDGFSAYDLESLVKISNQEQISVGEIPKIVDLFKYGTKENFWENLDKNKIENAEIELKKRVLGQDAAIKKSVGIIRRAKLGLHSIDQSRPKNKPKGVLFFAGPTGVGKTELAKSLAVLIFSDEDALLRFDMSEYNDNNSDVKLIGSPPGYVGHEEGGQLTSQVKSKPFSIILFDEIEKAHPVVFDKFLQILDDGRLTDGKGETVYFSESLVVFTSNLGVYKEKKYGRRIPNIKFNESYDEMKKLIMDEIRHFFNSKLNRPEILNRFGDNFVVFDYIRPDVDKLILEKNLKTIKDNLLTQKDCHFEYDDRFVEQFRKSYISDNLINGGRGINNRIETYIKNGITDFMFSQSADRNLNFQVLINPVDGNVEFKCIGG